MFDFSSIALPVVFSITSHFACVRLVSNPLSFCISFYFLHYLGDSGNTVISKCTVWLFYHSVVRGILWI